MFTLTALVLTLSTALSAVLCQEECNEKLLTKCLTVGVQFTVTQFDLFVNDSLYCDAAKKSEKCMAAYERCKDLKLQKTKMIPSFAAHLKRICTNGIKGYKDFAACFRQHSNYDPVSCSSDGTTASTLNGAREHEDLVKEICSAIDAVQCRTKLFKEECDKGESFGTVLEKSLAELQTDACTNQATTDKNTLSTVLSQEECNEELLTECLNAGVRFTEMQFIPLFQFSLYCEAANKSEECMGAYERCKDQIQKTQMIASYAAHLKRICTNGIKGYEDFAACFRRHSIYDSVSCSSDGTTASALNGTSKHEDLEKEICSAIDAVQCRTKLVKEECEKGKSFGTVFEKSLAELQTDACNNQVFTTEQSTAVYNSSTYYFWILALTFCVLLSL